MTDLRVITRMKLIEIFLPLADNSGRKLRKRLYSETGAK
jgi:hypothetical protein